MSNRNIIYQCVEHDLKYEHPAEWEKEKMSSPECPLCINKELTRLSKKYIEVKQQRDKLLDAIEIKRNHEATRW